MSYEMVKRGAEVERTAEETEMCQALLPYQKHC